ncbi:class I SAM-dependent methyltransferase [Adhaeribacter swui]|uniref:Class I SAM-dependent methyltransferase n=1 Tax=Adhaeribacter swui TaxID=2086471 RepID=A0A7G7G5C9_9BACT|nr:O-methyltransferase [Adhaeribacter swui]QNF32363.1 class I SAM-dependent methyltransferase [Adhaeribacter swui]
MDFLPLELQQYVEKHTSAEPEILKKLNRDTHVNVMKPRMLSGHFQGRLLAMISQMLRPQYVLEIGTYTGYSAICLAEGLAPGGLVHTIDVNVELEEMVRRYFAEAGVADKIKYYLGPALEIIPTLPYTFDLVFIDADKLNNANYFDLVLDKVRPGGFILTDNVLWSGKVTATNNGKIDKDTQSVLDFNRKVQEDSRVENILLPIRDGLLIARKI